MDIEQIVAQCRKEYENGSEYKKGRIKDWQATEDLYYGKVKKTLKGRFNVPIPVMSGFTDTLMSKIDEAITLKFKPAEEADYRKGQKVQAFWDKESKSEDNDYSSKDLDGKKLGIFYGRTIFKTYAEGKPKFHFHLLPTDPYDFFCDPMGGGDLENHRFIGFDNIFKTKTDLIAGANDGTYIKGNVHLIVNGLAEQVVKDNDREDVKASRLSALGLSQNYNFVGDGVERFIEQGTTVNGVRYYVLYHYESGLAIRCLPLKEVFASNLWFAVSWATHRDTFNFWSKAPADDIRPIAEVIKVLANQELDNRQKKNWGMRAYDPEMFPNGAELEYRPGGLVAVKAGASKVQAIANGIYEFETPELNGTINLVQWLDNFVGQKSGVTPDTQGKSGEDKVGIYQGNMQQVADRLGLYNKSYVRCQAAIGRRFLWGVYEHLPEKTAVKIIGERGIEWDELRGKDVDPDMDIVVEGGSAQLQIDEAKKENRTKTLLAIKQDQNLVNSVNKKWLLEQLLINGEYEPEEIRTALDVENEGDREILAKASECIQEIVAKKQPRLVRGATTGFQQKILDFALDNTDGDLELFNRLVAFAEAHNEIVIENMNRKAIKQRMMNGIRMMPDPNQVLVSPEKPMQPMEPAKMEAM